MTQEFSDRFPQHVDKSVAEQNFINRASTSIFLKLQQYRQLSYDESYGLLEYSTMLLGVPFRSDRGLGHLVNNDFRRCLRVIEVCYNYFRSSRPDVSALVDIYVGMILDETNRECDLGIEWKGDHFARKGVPELEGPLVTENLKWLDKRGWENVRAPLKKAFDALYGLNLSNGASSDVARDAHEALEALAKVVLAGRGQKELSANREILLKEMKSSEEMKALLKAYVDYANAVHRHASPNPEGRSSVGHAEVEFFAFMSAAFIRFAASSSKD